MTKPTAKAICESVGISPSYASMILGGDRTPPKSLAIAIFRGTGWRHPSIRKVREDEMQVFERHDPWTPPAARPTSPPDQAVAA